MTEAYLLGFIQNALMVTMMMAVPVLLVSLVVGSLVSMFQAATQINEATLTFVPKIIGIGLVLLLAGPWMGQQIVAFTVNTFTGLANLPR